MDSSPNQPQPSSSGRNVQKANEKRIAKMEKERETASARLANIAAAKQAKQTRRRQQGGTANLQAVVQARPQLRRQESALDLVPCFNPLYPQEEYSFGYSGAYFTIVVPDYYSAFTQLPLPSSPCR